MNFAEFSVGNEGRQVYWNAESYGLLFYPLAAIAMAIFAYGIYRRWQLWVALGKPELRIDNLGPYAFQKDRVFDVFIPSRMGVHSSPFITIHEIA